MNCQTKKNEINSQLKKEKEYHIIISQKQAELTKKVTLNQLVNILRKLSKITIKSNLHRKLWKTNLILTYFQEFKCSSDQRINKEVNQVYLQQNSKQFLPLCQLKINL